MMAEMHSVMAETHSVMAKMHSVMAETHSVMFNILFFYLVSLWVNTTNALCDKNGVRYTREDLVEDPLLVLKCNPSVFQ